MNILLVTPWKPSDTGGISTVVTMLSRQFHKQGHQVTVLVTNGDNRLLPMGRSEDASVYSVYLRTPYSARAPYRALASFCLFLPFTLYQLHRFLARNCIQVVVIQYPLANDFYFALIRLLSCWTLTVTYQGNDAHDVHLWTWIDRALVRFLLRGSDAVTGVSQSLLNKVSREFPTLPLKSPHVIHNGAPLELIAETRCMEHSPALPPDYVLTAGHLIHRKGIDVLIQALRIATDGRCDMNLVVAGAGPELGNLTELARRMGVSNRVHFVGNQSHEQVLELMRGCLFFALASRAEGMPLVVAEAMACGKAVVSTDVDGIPEIVEDGGTGLLVEPDNPQSLADVLVRLYRDPLLRQNLASRGKERALREYNWEVIAKRYADLFHELRSKQFLPQRAH